jgi:hypothetical protein
MTGEQVEKDPVLRCERYAVNMFQLREQVRRYDEAGGGMTAEQTKELLAYIRQAMYF